MPGGQVGWVGLQDFLNEGTFTWADGASLGSYTNWANNQPDNNGQGQVRAWPRVTCRVSRVMMCSTAWPCELTGCGMTSSAAETGQPCARGCPRTRLYTCHIISRVTCPEDRPHHLSAMLQNANNWRIIQRMLLVNEVFQTRKIINANGHKLTAYCVTLCMSGVVIMIHEMYKMK